MSTNDVRVLGLIYLIPTHAKDEQLRQQFESELKAELVQEVPTMVMRLAKLEPLIALEVEVWFLDEALKAFQYGLWRAVIGLVGIVAESLTESLYAKLTSIQLTNGKQMSKAELLGDRPSQQSKLAVLFLSGQVESTHYKKLVQIKKLRDLYVHPPKKARNAEQDALTAMRLLQSVLKERFDKVYTFKQGKIVERQDS